MSLSKGTSRLSVSVNEHTLAELLQYAHDEQLLFDEELSPARAAATILWLWARERRIRRAREAEEWRAREAEERRAREAEERRSAQHPIAKESAS